MYDKETANLIRSSPQLSRLNTEELPEQLTRAYAEILSARVRLREIDSDDDEKLDNIINTARKLAHTYEALVIVNPERENITSSAFVAATAYQLVFQTNHLRLENEPVAYLNANSISSEISALLLFLISESFADASDVASSIKLPIKNNFLQYEIILSLVYLAQGKISNILKRKEIEINKLWGLNDINKAIASLYYMLLSGIRELCKILQYGNEGEINNPLTVFQEVKDLAAPEISKENIDFLDNSQLMFPGPYHLASLLNIVGGVLFDCGIKNLKPPNGISEELWYSSISHIAKSKPFLWKNHWNAIEKGYLNNGTSAAINFPTGAGKSIIAQLKILSVIHSHKSVVFLAPTHALVDQTVQDLKKIFPKVPIQGDSSKINELGFSNFDEISGGVYVMTPEACLQHNSYDPVFYKDFGLLVFDECHLIHPKPNDERRAIDAMLCILNFARNAPKSDIILISAMMNNVTEVAEWLQYLTSRKSIALSGDWKPTRQLRGCLVYNNVKIEELNSFLKDAKKKYKDTHKNPPADVKRELKEYPYAFFSVKQTWESMNRKDYSWVKLSNSKVQLSVNKWYNLTPNTNEIAANIAAEAAKANIRTLIIAQQIPYTISIADRVKELLGSCEIELSKKEMELYCIAVDEMGDANKTFLEINDNTLVSYAGVHHGVLLPQERRLVESLFKKSNDFCVLACTSTLSEGMNLPAELVIIANDQKFNSTTKKTEMLDPEKLLNAAGRAGRAGKNSTGIVLVIPGNVIIFDEDKNKIGNHWTDLQKIFCQSDQCLELDDPLTAVMDRIYTHPEEIGDFEHYVISRLVDKSKSEDSEEKIDDIYYKSFTSFRKQKNEDEDWILNRLKSAKDLLNNSETTEEIGSSLFLASTLGIPDDILTQLTSDVLKKEIYKIDHISQLIDWMFEWLLNNHISFFRLFNVEEIEKLFNNEFKNISIEQKRVEYAVQKINIALEKWMNGVPLCKIQPELNNDSRNSNFCISTRRFVVRTVPNLAHILCAPVKIIEHYSESIESDHEISNPSLHYCYQCIKYGYSSAEMAAFASLDPDYKINRTQIHREFSKIEEYLESATDKETVDSLKQRVEDAALLASAFTD